MIARTWHGEVTAAKAAACLALMLQIALLLLAASVEPASACVPAVDFVTIAERAAESDFVAEAKVERVKRVKLFEPEYVATIVNTRRIKGSSPKVFTYRFRREECTTTEPVDKGERLVVLYRRGGRPPYVFISREDFQARMREAMKGR